MGRLHSRRNSQAVKDFPDTDIDTLENVAKRYKEIDAWNKDPILKEHSLELLQVVMKKQAAYCCPYDKIVTTEFAEKLFEYKIRHEELNSVSRYPGCGVSYLLNY